MEDNPFFRWATACAQAIRDAEMAEFEQQGDVVIESAHALLALAHRLKGIACPACNGFGSRAYSSTATWMGGIAGQEITSDVCDICWGTGRTDQKGADLRKLYRKVTR